MKTFGLLGSVTLISRSRLILVKIEKTDAIPEIGSKVLDATGFEIGRVVDIIGPISKPYAVVKPKSYAILSSIKPSTVLFYRITKREKKKTVGGRV